jgi:hypothetical protein
MATGWAADGAVQDQIDATIKDGIERARAKLPTPSPRRAARRSRASGYASLARKRPMRPTMPR